MHTIAENKQAIFQFDPNRKILKSTYKGIFKYNLAKEIYGELGDIHFVAKIADVRKLNGSFMKLMSEFREKYPILRQHGLKAEAFVVSDDLMINNLVDKLCIQLNEIGIDTFVCTTLEEAENWLEKYLK